VNRQPFEPTAAFRHTLRDESADIWQAIFALPFLQELSTSRLPLDRFAFFIAQDLLYLDEFARVLAMGAARSTEPRTQEMFLRHAQNVSFVEQALHSTIAPQIGLDPDVVRQQEPAPVTTAYTDHLLRVAHSGHLAELVAAILPCYEVYRRVGEHLASAPPQHPLYATWVASYASPEFGRAVEEQLELADRLATHADVATCERMATYYRRSIRYEWMFWQQAYDRLAWPVGRTARDKEP